MPSLSNPLRGGWSKPAALLGSALLALTLACGGGGGGGGGSSNPPPAQPYAELLFVADGSSIRTITASGTTRTELGTATIPGLPGTYTRSGSLVTVTMANHQVRNGIWMELVFSAGTGGTATSGKYRVTVVDDNTFTLTDSASGTITGGNVLRKPAFTMSGTYSQAGTTVTVTSAGHGLAVNDQVELAFTSGGAASTAQKITAITPDTFTATMPGSATASGNVSISFGTNYTVFDVAMHPSGKWLYVASGYDCPWGTPYCWGGDLISRYAINWTSGALTLESSIRARAKTKWDIPVAMAFNADGSRLFNQDDEQDGLRLWNVDLATGALTYVAESDSNTTSAHGLAVSSDGTRVYHGDNVFSVTSTAITRVQQTTTSSYDNHNLIMNNVLYGAGTDSTWKVKTYSLATPAAPVILGSFATGTMNQARDIAVSANGARIITSGWGGLKVLNFDGTAITAVTPTAGELRDGGNPWPANNTVRRMYRSVSLNKDGNLVAAAYFTNTPNTPSGAYKSGPPSGYILASLASDGSLALVSDTTSMTYARVARFFKKP